MESDLIKMSAAASIALVVGIIQNVLYRIVLFKINLFLRPAISYWPWVYVGLKAPLIDWEALG